MNLLILLVLITIVTMYNRVKSLVFAVKDKNKDSIKFEIFLLSIVLITASILIFYAISKIE